MQKKIFFIFVLFFQLSFSQQRNEDLTIKQGWTNEVDIGLDFLSNILINPTVGSGENRLGIGASLKINSIYNNGKFSWANDFNINYGIQKIGSGTLEDEENPDEKVPFQKNIDNIWLNSKIALRTSYFSKFYYTGYFFFNSQISPTYEDNLLSDTNNRDLISNFLSPATLQYALGMEYKPNNFFSAFLSPVSLKSIIVLDEEIADDLVIEESGEVVGTIHGNPFEIQEDGSVIVNSFNNQFGATFQLEYENEFYDKLFIKSNLLLFSNYSRDPDNIDINWRNEISFTIYKGLKLSVLSNLTYDDEVFVQISDNNSPAGVNGLGRRVSYTQQFLLKYSFVIDKNKE